MDIGTHILIVRLDHRWQLRKDTTAYTETQLLWLYGVAPAAVLVVGFIWYMAAVSGVNGSWVLALLLTLVPLKVLAQRFHYGVFRRFLQATLYDAAGFRPLNLVVLPFHIFCRSSIFFT